MIKRFPVRWLEGGLLLLGLLLVGVWIMNRVEADAFQVVESRGLEAALRPEPSSRTAASGPAGRAAAASLPKGTSASIHARRSAPAAAVTKRSLGRIEIPRLRISGMIAEGSDNRTLRHAVGHVRSTSQPGEGGNVALAAHRDGLFRGLGGVLKDDLILIVTPRGTFSYRVEWTAVVDPHRVDVLDPTDDPSLTLITCYPFNWIGHAPKRFVVRAKQRES